jgi:branched-chain amino acid transport system ATP-binding protein
MTAILEIERLCVAYGEVSALDSVTMSIHSDEAVALVGANGAGKSTLFKSIVGFLRPRSGSLRFRGRDLVGLRPERRVRLGLGYAPEGRRVFPGLTVRENLEVAVFGGKPERARRLERAFDLFPQLAEHRNQPGWQLSGGQQQMLAIGRGLMAGPKLLILDEPSLGLAPRLVTEMFDLIQGLRAQGLAILLAEQNAQLSLAIANRGYVIENGRVALSGSGQDLLESKEVADRYLGVGAKPDRDRSGDGAALAEGLRALLRT